MNGAAPSIEVLSQRLSNTDQAVSNLQNQFAHNFAKLENQIQLIGDRMSAAQRPQWQLLATILITMITVVGAAWGLGTRPINADIERQGQNIGRLEAALSKVAEGLALLPQTYLSRQEYTDNRLQARQDNENRFRGILEEMAALEAGIKENREMIVPRGEHEEHWRSQSAQVEAARQERLVQIESLQRQINEVQEGLGGIYGARDVIRDLQEQVQRLTAMVMSGQKVAP